MIVFQKARASTLLITMVIALVIGILCSSLILLSYFHRINDINNRINEKLNRNLESGINIALSDSVYSMNRNDTVDLFGQKNDSVEISRKNWLLFNAVSVRAFSGNKSREAQFIYGSELSLYMDGCLYLADKQRPLALVGDVKLIGNAYLPKAGLKPSFIDQRGFSYKELITGDILQSADKLPSLDSQILNNLRVYLAKIEIPAANYLPINSLSESITNSFKDSVLFYFDKEEIDLSFKKIQGQVIIISNKKITVDSTSNLSNIVLIAPEINFKKGFSGTVQALATHEINIESRCQFEYPSGFVIINRLGDLEQSKLKIASEVKLNGIILGINDNSSPLNKILVEIENRTSIYGIVYVNGYLSVKGKVYGTVVSSFFIHRSPSTIYENYLVDVELNRKKLSPYFLVSPVFNKKAKNKIIKWVN